MREPQCANAAPLTGGPSWVRLAHATDAAAGDSLVVSVA